MDKVCEIMLNLNYVKTCEICEKYINFEKSCEKCESKI